MSDNVPRIYIYFDQKFVHPGSQFTIGLFITIYRNVFTKVTLLNGNIMSTVMQFSIHSARRTLFSTLISGGAHEIIECLLKCG